MVADLLWQACGMGAWGSGPFDNDDAADLAGDLSDLTAASAVAAMLDDALVAVTSTDGYIEAPEMSRAVAAAVIVAIFADSGLPTPTALDPSWIAAVREVPSDPVRTQAARVMTRAFQPQDNEWHELWVEADLLDEVRTSLTPYATVLGLDLA